MNIYIYRYITLGIYGAIHNPITKCLFDIKNNTLKVYKLIKSFLQVAIKYFMHTILNKCEVNLIKSSKSHSHQSRFPNPWVLLMTNRCLVSHLHAPHAYS